MTDTQQVIVGEVVAGEAAATRRELEAKIDNTNKDAFDIAELLHKVKKNSFYAPEFNTYPEYVRTLKIKERRAQYLRTIAYTMEFIGIPRSVYEPLGISRLRAITSIDVEGKWTNPDTGEVIPHKDFILGFVEKGEDITVEDIKMHIRTLKGQVGDNDLVWRNLRMLRGVANNTWDPAIELARKQIGSTHKDEDGISKDASDGACAEVLAISFLNDPANEVLAGEA